MGAEKKISDGSLNDIIDSLNSLSPGDFKSSLKSLPSSSLKRIKKLKGLSSLQMKTIEKHLHSPPKKSSVLIAEKDGYIPLKKRLNAWWNGDDIKVSKKRTSKINSRSIEISEEPDNYQRWDSGNISMAQNLWGEGFAEPGGPAFAKKVLLPMKFESSNTILDLSAGLGGTSCILAKEYNLWLDAYEANADLAARGYQFASRHGMASKVPIEHVDFETLDLPKKKYDQIYSRDSLFMIKNKKNVIKQIAKSLKHKGQVLIVDYMLSENSNSAAVKKWLESEPERPHPWTSDLYRTALTHYGITVWTTNDLSEEYLEQIHEGWLEMVNKIDKGNFDRNSINALMREGEIWLNRAHAIEAGDLTIKRIHGVA